MAGNVVVQDGDSESSRTIIEGGFDWKAEIDKMSVSQLESLNSTTEKTKGNSTRDNSIKQYIAETNIMKAVELFFCMNFDANSGVAECQQQCC